MRKAILLFALFAILYSTNSYSYSDEIKKLREFEKICDNSAEIIIKIFKEENCGKLLKTNISKLENKIMDKTFKVIKNYFINGGDPYENYYSDVIELLEDIYTLMIISQFSILYLQTIENCGLKSDHLDEDYLRLLLKVLDVYSEDVIKELKDTELEYYADINDMIIDQSFNYVNNKFKIKELILNKCKI